MRKSSAHRTCLKCLRGVCVCVCVCVCMCTSNISFSINYGEGDGTPLQYSCLENPKDGGAW